MRVDQREKQNCSGCGLCSKLCPVNAIVLKRDDEGFLYPKVELSLCINCGKCAVLCPLEQSYFGNEPINVFAAKHIDAQVQMNSTSGGVFTALAAYVIAQGGSVYGAGFAGAKKVIHKRVTDLEAQKELADSKYIQSEIISVYDLVKNDLKSGLPVLFTGTPCQNHALKLYIADDSLLEKLVLCDIVCHGVPSPGLYEEHLNMLEKQYKDTIVSVRFRSKEYGWDKSNKRFLKCQMKNGSVITDELFYKLYFQYNIISRPSCQKCIYASRNRVSDITLGDFWGFDQSPVEDGCGISLVMVNSCKGKDLFFAVQDSFVIWNSTLEHACKDNPRIISPSVFGAWRKPFWNTYKKMGYHYTMRTFCGSGLINNIRRKIFIRSCGD